MGFWPDGYQGAISLSFDDGMRSHLEFVVPQLNAHQMRGTFYLNPRSDPDDERSDSWKAKLEPWIPVQADGHEIGNHTVSHPCSLNIRADWLEGKNLRNWTLAQVEADIAEAQTRINTVFPAQKHTSFAYPCYESSVGFGAQRVSYTPVVTRYCNAARSRGELRGDLANDPEYCDLHHLSSWAVERQPGAMMIGLVEQAIAFGRWGIFTVHGIHEGHLPIGDSDFLELINHLQRRREAIWTAPVAQIAAYLHNNK